MSWKQSSLDFSSCLHTSATWSLLSNIGGPGDGDSRIGDVDALGIELPASSCLKLDVTLSEEVKHAQLWHIVCDDVL